MIHEYSIQCSNCDSYHTEWNPKLRCLVCCSCGNHIRLEDNFKTEKSKELHASLMKGKEGIMPGDRVMVYDTNKRKMRCATVIKRYGIVTHMDNGYLQWPYCDLCDVKIKDRISKAHFTYGLEVI